MKKMHTLLFGVIFCAAIITACNNQPKTEEAVKFSPMMSSSSKYYPDSVLDKYVWRVFSNGNGRFELPFYASITVDTSTSPPTLTTTGQAGSYTTLVTENVKYTVSGTQMVCSSGSNIGPDTTRQITYLGPFDPVTGHFYSSNAQMHYVYSGGKDSTLGYISHFIWMGQSGNGGGIALGLLNQENIKN